MSRSPPQRRETEYQGKKKVEKFNKKNNKKMSSARVCVCVTMERKMELLKNKLRPSFTLRKLDGTSINNDEKTKKTQLQKKKTF